MESGNYRGRLMELRPCLQQRMSGRWTGLASEGAGVMMRTFCNDFLPLQKLNRVTCPDIVTAATSVQLESKRELLDSKSILIIEQAPKSRLQTSERSNSLWTLV